MAEIGANLCAVRQRVDRAAGRSGRDPSAVELLVVTKTWPPEVIAEVLEAGHELLGENKLQEAWAKIPELPASARWHFIGHLQRNKARKALDLFEAIHSVDSLRLAHYLDRVAGELGKRPRIYLQVNAVGEESKSGFAVEELREALPGLLSLENVELAGLMSIPPAAEDPEIARSSFRELRKLRDDLEAEFEASLPGLSMGMSHDFEVAIEEGATIVRVGSSIFGSRGVAVSTHKR
ncbi:MAG: YggS family pyridoxal phosphate-dependent enzyme [Roseibacillus sp.]|jgi:pyridoxal phosphate enzyme (YggS family)|nr:YggS family pyridoxal phosphate-dependent enzyme [Roseibacillus sp.]MCP4731664.1 YggS family pyridoxal phosphate-dependent enzyme [Roseibacillus sp.]MDP6207685.1 YggS family pyridoxal phosphate-dependent enzyme [Roseibacillus sp.]MDP7306000.1 YggS family pyridoxal phosphate-dependent enzyme [Roseibacillus sp.]MDP7655097.1 YggS family pyridoxal phosphate-dependent enzyme [Roseibacillus sp.]|tara:strand:- start:8034 stop:8741 length:708 start_codon:yes stop_codon:yes gene_type:complete